MEMPKSGTVNHRHLAVVILRRLLSSQLLGLFACSQAYHKATDMLCSCRSRDEAHMSPSSDGSNRTQWEGTLNGERESWTSQEWNDTRMDSV